MVIGTNDGAVGADMALETVNTIKTKCKDTTN